MQILSSKQENYLTESEKHSYCDQLRDYLTTTPHSNLTKGSLDFCPKINPIVRDVLRFFAPYEVTVDYSQDISGVVGLYAHTHQSKYDHVNFVLSNPNHTILLNSSILSPLYKFILNINGVIYVNKNDKQSRLEAKLEMMRLLLQGKSITIFPESAWNCSPNKIHLPFFIGVVDMARITGCPIIPVVQEYTYDSTKNNGREIVKKVHIMYGTPIYVSETDNSLLKLEEYSESISTMRWHLMQEKGDFQRDSISNSEYTNLLKGIVRNLKIAGIDINLERAGLFRANDDFYLFHHINDVPFDSQDNFLPTEHVKKLNMILNKHNL